MNTAMSEIGLVIALPEEFERLLALFGSGFSQVHDPEHGEYYYELHVSSGAGPCRILAAVVGSMGTDRAGRVTERLLQHRKLDTLVTLGMAGSLHDSLKLGDVIIADQIDSYLSSAKAVGGTDAEFEVERRGSVYRSDHGLVQRAVNFPFVEHVLHSRWQLECATRAEKAIPSRLLQELIARGLIRQLPELRVGHVASGPFVSASTGFNKWLQQRDGTLLAIEMEAAGSYAAAHERALPPRVVAIRGVSDLANETKDALESVSGDALRRYAMENAVRFLSAWMAAGTLCNLEAAPSEHDVLASSEVKAVPTLLGSQLHRLLIEAMLDVGQPQDILSGLRVLLVEDDAIERRSLCRILERAGVLTREASTGEEALSMLSNHPCSVVLSDLHLPGMDGFALCRKIQRKWPNVPTVIGSGFGASDMRQDVEDCGAVAFVNKPYHSSVLFAELREAAQCHRLRLVAAETWPHESQTWVMLSRCRRAIAEFVQHNGSQELFETVMRHKVKECVHSWARGAVSGTGCADGAERLLLQIAKLSEIMMRLKHGVPLGLGKYLEAMKADLEDAYPELIVQVTVPQQLHVEGLPEVSALFLLACIELVDNAKDALNGSGQIQIEIREHRTLPKVSLKVWNSGPPIPPTYLDQVFREGFSTKGECRGMGLSLLRRLARRFDGDLGLGRRPGVEFVVTVPLSNQGLDSAQSTIADAREGLGEPRQVSQIHLLGSAAHLGRVERIAHAIGQSTQRETLSRLVGVPRF
ncbi:MAG: response regulator [Polyangiaceae bacterium]|nr:response regulator [Polyangiaceae bacterium]